MLRGALTAAWILIAFSATVAGWEYYLTPAPERFLLEGDSWFSPSGSVGIAYGVLGFVMLTLGTLPYLSRRRSHSWTVDWRADRWLPIHIFFCTLGPFFILLHTSFRFRGPLAIVVGSMVLVLASGVFGYLLYVRIPKDSRGSFLTADSIREKRDRAFSALQNRGSLYALLLADSSRRKPPEPPRGLLHTLAFGSRWSSVRRQRREEIQQFLSRMGGPAAAREEIIALALEEAELGWQIAMVEPFRRIFEKWHRIHFPLAVAMFLGSAVHVGMVVLLQSG
jgi:hypothetical protein